MKKAFWVLLVLLLLPLCAQGETAQDVTSRCMVMGGPSASGVENMLDGSYATCFRANSISDGFVRVEMPEGLLCGGLYFTWGDVPLPFTVQVLDDTGAWRMEKEYGEDELYCNQYVPLGGVRAVCLRVKKSARQPLCISTLCVLSQGVLPSYVQIWHKMDGKADMMLVVAHPDDEWFWFGGLLPTYAGEKQKKVAVVYMTSSNARRRSELLDGLWLSGVQDYPVLVNKQDQYFKSKEKAYKLWGEEKTTRQLAEIIRTYQPDVILTQDNKGEYGHGAHKATMYLTVAAVKKAADPSYNAKSKAWQVKKCYVHLWQENQLRMDWNVPLAAFGGETGMQVAARALLCHVSQAKTPHEILDSGVYDCSLFGLYSSTVGEDTLKDDIFEHID